MTYDELVEVVARAICYTGYGELLYDVTSKERQDSLKEQAKAAIDTIREALQKPTREMYESAHKHYEGEAYLPHGLWSAMLAASPLGEKKG